jgi:hypothetical protein
LKSMESLASILGEVDDQPPVRRQSTISGTAPEQLPGIARIGTRGELTIEIDPKYIARMNPRR